MKEAISFVGGAALGAVFGLLIDAIKEAKSETAMFKFILNHLISTLKSSKLLVIEIEELNNQLGEEGKVTKSLISKMEEGEKLVRKCIKINPWNIYKRISYLKKLSDLDNSLKRMFKRLKLEEIVDIKEIKLMQRSIHSSIRRMEGSGKVYSQIELKGSCVVPEPSSFTVGLDVPLTELKLRLFNESQSLLLVTAPGGCGKTTLASIFCLDHDVKGIILIYVLIIYARCN